MRALSEASVWAESSCRAARRRRRLFFWFSFSSVGRCFCRGRKRETEEPKTISNSRAVLDGRELRELRLGGEGRGDGRGDGSRGGGGRGGGAGVCRQRSLRSKMMFARRFGRRCRSLALSLPPCCLWCRRRFCLGVVGHHALMQKEKKQKRKRTPQEKRREGAVLRFDESFFPGKKNNASFLFC